MSTYAYDVAGNKVRERTVTNGVTYQDNHLAYDALGRLRDVADGRVHISIDYDAVGNRMHVTSHVINAMDQSQDEDRWYQYDAMNRQTVVDGINANGDIGVGQGHKITYDKNGNRTSDTYYGARVQADRVFDHTEWTSVWGVTGSDEAGNPTYGYIVQPSAAYSTQYTAVNGLTTEAYDYDSNNRLSHVSRDGVLLDTRFYDGANRVVQTGPAGALPQEYVTALNGAAGGNGSETRQSTYDQNGRLLHQKVTKSDGAAKYEVNYSQYDGAGNVVSYSMANQDGDGYTNNYTYTMARFDGYKEARVDGTSDKFDPGSTTSDYDVNGSLVSVTDSTKPENNRTFVNDAQGHVLYVNQGGHTQRQLVVDGEVLGRYGDMINPDAPQDPNTGNPSFINKADFSFGFQPINGKYPTGAPGAIAVQAGDTLESIAHSAYGDSKLWYLIAEANGLSGNSDLRVGQSLTIPNRVSTIHNDSKTFKPYDPSQVIGDTTPNLPMPAAADSGGGCGGLGTIIMVVVAVVATVMTAGAAAVAAAGIAQGVGAAAALADAGFSGVMAAGGAALTGGAAAGAAGMGAAVALGGIAPGVAVSAAMVGGVVGSFASQLTGVAIGAQNGINFGQIALSGLAAGIGSGAGAGIGGASIGVSAVRAAATNIAVQGVGVVTGLQSSFNWTSVAASAAGGAVGGALNGGGANSIAQSINDEIGGVLGRTVTGMLVGTAAAATTSVLRGGRIAMQQVATDAFGNALGQSLASQSSTAAWDGTLYGKAPSISYLDKTPVSGIFVGADSVDPAIPEVQNPDGSWTPPGAPTGLPADGLNVITIGKGQGVLSALDGAGVSDSYAAYGQLARTGQLKFDAKGMPIVRAGQELYLDSAIAADGDSALGRKLTSAEGANRIKIAEQIAKAQAEAAAASESYREVNRFSGFQADNQAFAAQQATVQAAAVAPSNSGANIVAAALGGEFSVLSSDLPADVASGYAGPARAIADPAARAIDEYKLGPRALGLAGTVAAGYGVAGAAVSLNPQATALALDQMYANAQMAVTGQSASSLLNQGLRGTFGLNEQQAALGELAVTFGASGGISATRELVGDAAAALRSAGVRDWNIKLAPYTPGTLYSNPVPLQLEPIAPNGTSELTQVQINSQNGAAFQARVAAYGSNTLNNFLEEVSIRPFTNAVGDVANFRVRLDGVGTDPNTSKFNLMEAKASEAARLTRNQTAGFPLIEQYGGVVVGNSGNPSYPAGTVIPPTTVQVVRPSNLQKGY